jgi:hypothetical protein
VFTTISEHGSGVGGRQIAAVSTQITHVSLLQPKAFGNQKLALQQGRFTWGTVQDAEPHIRRFETDDRKFLWKYELNVRERPKVMRELSLMGQRDSIDALAGGRMQEGV